METVHTKIDDNYPQIIEDSYEEESDHSETDAIVNNSMACKDEKDITIDITRKLSTLQIAKSACKVDGCQIKSSQVNL